MQDGHDFNGGMACEPLTRQRQGYMAPRAKKLGRTNRECLLDAAGPLDHPLYRQPEILAGERHDRLCLAPAGNFRFARHIVAAPLADDEFGEAGRFYPIIFTDADAIPMAVLGQDDNAFVDQDGQWHPAGSYIPRFLRCYPFLLMQDEGRLSLGIDLACERVNESVGEPLFVDGEPSELLNEAFRACEEFDIGHQKAREFSTALEEQAVLARDSVTLRLPGGQRYCSDMIKYVDKEMLLSLPPDVVQAWHSNGWLGLAHLHLASLGRFKDVTERLPRIIH